MASKVLKQRPGTVKRASDAFLLFVELEQAEAVLVSSITCAAGLLHSCNCPGSLLTYHSSCLAVEACHRSS